MRLVLVGPVYPYRGGIAHYTTMLYRALREREHEVLLVSFKRQYPQWLFPGKSDKDPSETSLRVNDARYWIDSLNPWTWFRTFVRIVRYRPDLLVLQWWVSYWVPLWLVFGVLNRFWLKAPLLFICHNVLPHESRHQWLDKFLAGVALRWGDNFIVQSNREKTCLRDVVSKKIIVVPQPMYNIFNEQRVTREEARVQLKLELDDPVVLFFGIVREYKGLEDLLESLPSVRERFPGVKVLIAGEFWDDENDYLAQIERLGLETIVTLDNRYIPNEEVPVYFSAADVLVAPYRRKTGSGVIQVARAFGLPVITTSEEDSSNSLMVAPGNVAALTEVLIDFLESCKFGKNVQLELGSFSTWEDLVIEAEGCI